MSENCTTVNVVFSIFNSPLTVDHTKNRLSVEGEWELVLLHS